MSSVQSKTGSDVCHAPQRLGDRGPSQDRRETGQEE